MQIRIKTLPPDRQLDDFDLRPFEIGRVYEVAARLGELLIVLEYAEPEMRRADRDPADNH